MDRISQRADRFVEKLFAGRDQVPAQQAPTIKGPDLLQRMRRRREELDVIRRKL